MLLAKLIHPKWTTIKQIGASNILKQTIDLCRSIVFFCNETIYKISNNGQN
jgi:hypothetical protein